jgi:hypothetical protein
VDSVGISQYCNAIRIVPRDKVNAPPKMLYVPISKWQENRPLIDITFRTAAVSGNMKVCWDTGSPINIMSKDTANALGFKPGDYTKLGVHKDGRDKTTIQMVVFSSIEMTDVYQKTLRFTNVPVLVVEGTDFPLVLGWTLFGLFDQIIINAYHAGKECIGIFRE